MKLKNCFMLSLLLLFNIAMTVAQGKTISGNVSDDTGMPLPGANIIIKGTTTGAQSDFDGNYTITASVGDVLQFSYVGMTTVEKTVGASNVINVVLAMSNELEEVVVMGYGSQSRTELTSSTVQVDAEEIELVPVSTVDQVLQGKVAGLVFNGDSGTPGSTTDIRIRGVSSITAGNEPLYVIDGVPMNNDNVSATSSGSSLSALASINSNNIESITVLKDASATAAYGARGANGVIVITTKSGKKGKTTFNFSSSYGFGNDATDGPTVLTGAQREMLFYEALINTYGAGFGFNDQAGAKAFYEANPNFFGTDYAVWNANGRQETNWADLITNEDAPIQEYNLSARGGNENYNFYTSFGYFDQEATVIGSEFNRMTGTINFSQKLSDNIRFSTRNSASHTYQDGLLEASAYFSSPRAAKYFQPAIEPAYNEDGTINVSGTVPNPLWIAQEDIDDSKFTRIISNNSFEWDTPIDGLKLTSRANIDYQVYNYKRYRNRVRGDGDGDTSGYGWQAHNNIVTYVFQNTLDYTWNINDDHSIDFTAVQEFQKNRNYYLDADGDSFATDGLTNLASAGNPTSAFSSFEDWALARYVGIIHYSGYNGKYVIDGTFTREGNSRFSSANRWGNFWSVGAAWNLHKESLLENSEVINNLKLRGSFGVTGNANISLNQYQAQFGFEGSYAGQGAINPDVFGNDNLSWETSHTLDVGIDFGLFNNIVSGTAGYYKRESKNLLLDVPLSFTTGFDEQTRNIGRMENKGFEVELNIDIVRSKDFNLSIGGNMATTKNEVLELAKDGNGETINISGGSRTRTEEGQPVWGWHMRKWAGVDPANGDELYYLNGKDGATTNNWNIAERAFQGGSAIPELTAGMNIHVDYKGFFLDANGYFAGGHKVYEDWHRYTNGTNYFSTLYYQGVDAVLDRWQQPGDTGKRFGRFEATAATPWQASSKFLYEGDYFRLKNLTIGYDFKAPVLDAVGLDGARVFVRGTNILTWVKDENLKYDPEVDAGGVIGLTTPPVKSFIFGLNVKF
ncbi:SusC/RagA family TonB-linked outer membrane protein [Pontimicrobium aquaticum]|uniref:TonB-dependent receptor n=1 Tax=Pontimicrobium aquaticum TaxID=2565367 RepID=A0A4U0EYG3_9FLAO|nr:TonB-dependent receptor [Pontimicrobium aquaticum]TJY37053.1 TonB-dependent receptor [Pontimicrobium aquaticum]